MAQFTQNTLVSSIRISQSSVATPLRFDGIFNHFCCKLSAKCVSEIILKIGQYLTNVWWHVEPAATTTSIAMKLSVIRLKEEKRRYVWFE